MHNFTFPAHNTTFSYPVRACVAPVCDFKSEVEVVTHNEKFEACWGNVKDMIS